MKNFRVKPVITEQSSDLIKTYLKEISKFPLLSATEETALFARIKKHDKIAREKLINSNLRFVVTVAKQYQNQGLPLLDLIEEGTLGLIHAIDKFDSDLGFKFITYAVWWIRQYISQAIAEKGKLVRVPIKQLTINNKLVKAISSFEQNESRTPSIGELSDISGENINVIQDFYNGDYKTSQISLDAPVDQEQDITYIDVLENQNVSKPDNTLVNDSLACDLQKILSSLSTLEKIVLDKLFGLSSAQLSVEELSNELNITTERVRQLKNQALMTIRKNPNVSSLLKYLG